MTRDLGKLRGDIRAALATELGPRLAAAAVGDPVCDACGEADPTTRHRERTGGPDGNLCDSCDHDADMAGAEPPQW